MSVCDAERIAASHLDRVCARAGTAHARRFDLPGSCRFAACVLPAHEALRSAGLDVRVNIVGFAVDEVVLKETFREWARVGNGGYFEAQDGQQLKGALRATLRPTYQVLAGEKVVATGTVDGDAVELPAGAHRVRVLGAPAKDVGEVALEAGALRELRY